MIQSERLIYRKLDSKMVSGKKNSSTAF
jgi:hypothetical protein